MNELSYLLLAICVMVGVILLAGGLYQIEYRRNRKEWDENDEI